MKLRRHRAGPLRRNQAIVAVMLLGLVAQLPAQATAQNTTGVSDRGTVAPVAALASSSTPTTEYHLVDLGQPSSTDTSFLISRTGGLVLDLGVGELYNIATEHVTKVTMPSDFQPVQMNASGEVVGNGGKLDTAEIWMPATGKVTAVTISTTRHTVVSAPCYTTPQAVSQTNGSCSNTVYPEEPFTAQGINDQGDVVGQLAEGALMTTILDGVPQPNGTTYVGSLAGLAPAGASADFTGTLPPGLDLSNNASDSLNDACWSGVAAMMPPFAANAYAINDQRQILGTPCFGQGETLSAAGLGIPEVWSSGSSLSSSFPPDRGLFGYPNLDPQLFNDNGDMVIGPDPRFGGTAPGFNLVLASSKSTKILGPGGVVPSGITGLNDSDAVIGSTSNTGDLAFLWTPAAPDGVSLQTLLPDGSGLTITSGVAVDNAGDILARGQDASGRLHDVVIVPGCSASGVTPQVSAPPVTLTDILTSSTPSCPLTVTVKQLEMPRSGLAVHSAHYNEAPVDFVDSSTASGENRFQCESGCVDLLIKVVNPKVNKAVVGAKVNVSIGEVAHLDGDGYLCAEEANGKTDTGNCGRYLSGLLTNSDGQLYVRYWVPGVVKAATSILNVTAKKACSATVCPTKELEGSATPTSVTVSPYLIYSKQTLLSAEQIEDLAAWSGGTAIFTKFLKASTVGPKVLYYSLKWLEAYATASEHVVELLEKVEAVEPIVGVIEVFKTFTELWERASMLAMFLNITGLNPIGLGDNPFEASVSKSPSVSFSTKVVNYGVVAPFNIGADGMWWNLASKMAAKDAEKGGWGITFKVYEVSYCDEGKSCEPGYGNDPGTSSVLRDGINPNLDLALTLTFRGYDFGDFTFTIPYDAIGWTEAQTNLKGVINDFG